MAGYTRADTGNNIADGNIVNASDLDAEYDAIEAAFNNSTGHTHDGTSAEGAPIEKVGPVQDLVVTATEVKPKTDNTLDLGTTTLEFKDAFFDGTVKTDTLTVDENATVTGNLTVNGNTTLGNANTDTVTITADVASNVIPSADDTYDLGAVGSEWKDLYIDGTANIDSLVADTADINAGTIDGTTIGGASAAAGTFTTATATTGNITTVNATTVDSTNLEVTNIKAKDGTSAGSIADSTGVVTLASSVLTTADINGGTIDGVTIGGSSAGAGTFTTGQFNTSLNVDGTVTADGATIDGNLLVGDTDNAESARLNVQGGYIFLKETNGGDVYFRSGYGGNTDPAIQVASADPLLFLTTNTPRMNIAANGDISFYEDTGTTPKLFWDASAEALGLGTASPLYSLHSSTTSGNQFIAITSDTTSSAGVLFGDTASAVRGQVRYFNNDDAMTIYTDGNERMRITSTGEAVSKSTSTITWDGVTDDTLGNLSVQYASTGGINRGPSLAFINDSLKFSTRLAYTSSVIKSLKNNDNNGEKDADLAFYTHNGTSLAEAMRIDSSGNVGIGKTPSVQLDVKGGTSCALQLTPQDGVADQTSWIIQARGDNGALQFYDVTASTEAMRIDSSGNLGLGVTPSAWGGSGVKAFDIGTGASFAGSGSDAGMIANAYYNGSNWVYKTSSLAVRYQQLIGTGSHAWSTAPSGTAGNTITFTQAMTLDASGDWLLGRTSTSSYRAQITGASDLLDIAGTSVSAQFHNKTADVFMIGVGSGDAIAFATGGNSNERMRIDSSGNLLVGTTSTSIATTSTETGTQIYDGGISIAANNPVAQFNRISSDGSIVNFRKDGTTVGSIGTAGGGYPYIAAPANFSLMLGNVEVLPRSNTGTFNEDGTITLGASNARFKDLYLSGGVYGNANVLKFSTNAGTTQHMTLDTSGNLLVGGTATPTSSAKNIVLYNGTAPTGNATDGVILYAEDVSASSELKVRDEAGNVTTLSPHNFDLIPEGPSEDMAWSYYSERDGKRINVDMLKAIRLLEQLTGEKLVHTN